MPKKVNMVVIASSLLSRLVSAKPLENGDGVVSTVIAYSTVIVDPTVSESSAYVFDTSVAASSNGASIIASVTTTSAPSSGSSGVSGVVAADIGATTTITAIKADKTSAPLAGNEVKTGCEQLWANVPSEDWLFATLCSWSTADPSWPLVNFDYAWEFKDPKDLPAVNVTTYDDDLKIRDPLMMSYEGVKADGNSNANDACLSMVNSTGKFKDIDDKDFREWAGYHALVNLLGMYPVREDPSQLNKVIWEMWLDKSSFSPITILSKNTTGKSKCLKDGDRYFSITKFDKATSQVTLWDPTSGGSTGYFQVDSEDLRQDTLWLFHLDWPRYEPTPRRSKSIK
ncbi:hypothetical protein V865_004451 [Kwoniella europaea PYCC6329]|uniref:Calpain catalytic domain-containing protein n=1 Tax=Kwoniella europaea PYCC6329 TaxID=1423913 RepID=A0AAX4KIX6_9TREE